MNNERFTQSVNQLFSECISTLNRKGNEYSTQDDRLHNFRTISQLTGFPMEKVVFTYLFKHICSIARWTPDTVPSEPIRGRIIDAINYLAFFNAIVETVRYEDDDECL